MSTLIQTQRKTTYNKEEIKWWLRQQGIDNFSLRSNSAQKPAADNNAQWLVDVPEDVDLTERGLKEIPVQFGVVKGSFNINRNELINLIGCPHTVEDGFYCNEAGLRSLEGAPLVVKGEVYLRNNLLTSLEWFPPEIGAGVDISSNHLISLRHLPATIPGFLNAYTNHLETLEGSPQQIEGSFNVSLNNLTSLKGGPQRVSLSYLCHENQLMSLERIGHVGLSISAYKNQLRNLVGLPENIKGKLSVADNPLLSLEGLPHTIGKTLGLQRTLLSSLDDLDCSVGENIYYSHQDGILLEPYLKYYETSPTLQAPILVVKSETVQIINQQKQLAQALQPLASEGHMGLAERIHKI